MKCAKPVSALLSAALTILLSAATQAQVLPPGVSAGGNDGSFSYAYPFALPPARGRYQPSLGLVYNSNAGTSVAGVGWSLPMSYIEGGSRASPADGSGDPRTQVWLVLGGSRVLLIPYPASQVMPPLYDRNYCPDVSGVTFRPDVGSSYAEAVWSRGWGVSAWVVTA